MIENLEEIVKIPYIDGFIFGPNDLSGSLGEFLNIFGESTFSKIKYATQILKKSGKYVGLAGGMSQHDIEIWSKLELDLLFAGADWCFVYNQGKKTLETLKKYFPESLQPNDRV